MNKKRTMTQDQRKYTCSKDLEENIVVLSAGTTFVIWENLEKSYSFPIKEEIISLTF